MRVFGRPQTASAGRQRAASKRRLAINGWYVVDVQEEEELARLHTRGEEQHAARLREGGALFRTWDSNGRQAAATCP